MFERIICLLAAGSQACLGSQVELIEKEISHMMAEKNELNRSELLLSHILFHCFVCQ